MTDDRITLQQLVGKSADADFLRDMIAFAAQRLMDIEVDTLCGASHGERTLDRTNSRNGYRSRAWETRAGTVDLHIPPCRQGPDSARSTQTHGEPE